MGRFVSAVLFLGTGCFVLWRNHSDVDRILVLPGLDVLWPALADDPYKQGDVSAGIFLGIGGLMLIWGIWKAIQEDKSVY
ncbi:MAG: hypothetical protein GXP62_17435 [Oligoflexia bacterium]|nr:hypothetical protein [Oligoflexia bacterium]